jgi:hypothetical protein
VTQPTPPAAPTQSRTARHVLRTFIQVMVAEAAAIPSLASAFNISAGTTAKITGGVGVIVVLVTALQNAGEDAGLIPTILENPVVKWVQQQVNTGQPLVAPPAPVPGQPDVPPVDPSAPAEPSAPVVDPASDNPVEPGTPSAGNETSVRAPRKRTPAKKTTRRKD